MLSLCLLSGCAKRSVQLPPIPPPTEASQGDPARDAQSRLLKEAYRAFVQERYPSAALFFNRFVETATESPRLAEARWWLGRTYEQLGDYRAAMAQYRLVTAGPLGQQVDGPLYEGHALRRLDELRHVHADQQNTQARQLAFRVTAGEFPSGLLLAPWLEELVQGGVTALVIEPFPGQMPGPSESTLESVKGIVEEAHRVGLLLWLTLDLHRGTAMELRPEWMARTVGSRGQDPVFPSRPDITNGTYQAYLEGFIRILSRTGCDGVLLTARPMTGFSDEFSEGSFHMFAESFGASLSPEEVLPAPLSDASVQGRAGIYWRWVGWKALSYAKLVMRLRTVLREANPTATMLVEVHQTTVTAPLQGLEQYGEDLAELNSRNGGLVVVRQESAGAGVLAEALGKQPSGMMDRAWVGISLKLATIPSATGGLSQAIRDAADTGPWKNLLLQAGTGPSVP
ncbi:MAG: tetratricopeptide repeat protein [Nitrospiraceae bacterium]